MQVLQTGKGDRAADRRIPTQDEGLSEVSCAPRVEGLQVAGSQLVDFNASNLQPGNPRSRLETGQFKCTLCAHRFPGEAGPRSGTTGLDCGDLLRFQRGIRRRRTNLLTPLVLVIANSDG